MKAVVRKRHVVPIVIIVAFFATIQQLMELNRPPHALLVGLLSGLAAGVLVWILATLAERNRLRRDE